jgi:hypothetical protein
MQPRTWPLDKSPLQRQSLGACLSKLSCLEPQTYVRACEHLAVDDAFSVSHVARLPLHPFARSRAAHSPPRAITESPPPARNALCHATPIQSMHGKSNITYLLNPAIQTKASCRTPDRAEERSAVGDATLSLFRSLLPPSPQTATSSLQYRRQLLASIAPYEKKHDRLQYLASKRARLPLMTLAALSSAASSRSSSSNASSVASSSADKVEEKATATAQSVATSTSAQAGKTRYRKTHTPPCQVEGCKNLAVSRGCCVRHGGGSRCTEPGCDKRAKLYQRCFQHGGFKTCTESGCTKKAKRYGLCWSHGGGHICEFPDCTKVSTQGGLCWAHGGGNRCKHEGCNRRSYLKYDYFCVRHASRRASDASASS